MRPVNLIPPEQRRGERAPLRTGALPYIILGALAAMLLAVTALVLTGNQVSEREAKLASLEVEQSAIATRAEALSSYAEFAALSEARDATVTSLAQSRFDWERVLRELALVIPDDVWLTQAVGTVSPAVTLQGGSGTPNRAEIAGPALELIGCGASHEAVAGFVAVLRDIDGVTRVGIASSERNAPQAEDTSADGATAAGGDPSTSGDCRTEDFIARFEIVLAFDAVPAPAAPEAAPAPGTTPAPGTPTSGSAEAPSSSTSSTAVPGVAR